MGWIVGRSGVYFGSSWVDSGSTRGRSMDMCCCLPRDLAVPMSSCKSMTAATSTALVASPPTLSPPRRSAGQRSHRRAPRVRRRPWEASPRARDEARGHRGAWAAAALRAGRAHAAPARKLSLAQGWCVAEVLVCLVLGVILGEVYWGESARGSDNVSG